MRLLALLVGASLTLGCSLDGTPIVPGGGRSCTLIGCVNGARLTIRVATTKERLLASTLEVCRNGQCSRATPTSVPDSAGSGSGGALAGPVPGMFTVWGPEAGAFKIDVDVRGEGPYPYGLKDGDQYTLRLLDASDAELAKTSMTATYAESYPNGRECDVNACRQAQHDGGNFTPATPADAGSD